MKHKTWPKSLRRDKHALKPETEKENFPDYSAGPASIKTVSVIKLWTLKQRTPLTITSITTKEETWVNISTGSSYPYMKIYKFLPRKRLMLFFHILTEPQELSMESDSARFRHIYETKRSPLHLYMKLLKSVSLVINQIQWKTFNARLWYHGTRTCTYPGINVVILMEKGNRPQI